MGKVGLLAVELSEDPKLSMPYMSYKSILASPLLFILLFFYMFFI